MKLNNKASNSCFSFNSNIYVIHIKYGVKWAWTGQGIDCNDYVA